MPDRQKIGRTDKILDLSVRRTDKNLMVFIFSVYRIVYSLVAIPTVVLIPTMSIRGNLFLVPYARTVTYQKSFFPDTIRIWNALDANTKTCTSLDQFKSEVQKTGLP